MKRKIQPGPLILVGPLAIVFDDVRLSGRLLREVIVDHFKTDRPGVVRLVIESMEHNGSLDAACNCEACGRVLPVWVCPVHGEVKRVRG